MNNLEYRLRLAFMYAVDFALGYPKEHTVLPGSVETRLRHTGGVWAAVRVSTYCKRRASWVKTNWRHGWRITGVPKGYERFLYCDNMTPDLGEAIYNLLECERLMDEYKAGFMEG